MSKFYEIDAQSKFKSHRVLDKDTETHNGYVDKARLIYSEADKRLCIGGLSGWNIITTPYDVFDKNTKVLFGSYPLPTGWNLDTAWNDRVVLLTDTSSETGDTGGSWTVTGINTAGSHTHTTSLGTETGNVDYVAIVSDYSASQAHTHDVSSDGGHIHSHSPGWRPYNIRYCVAEYQ